MNPVEGAKTALRNTRDATTCEKVVIFCDDEQREIGEVFANATLGLGLWTKLVVLETTDEIRTELEERTRELITLLRPDLYVNLFRDLDEETAYRIQFNKLERLRKARVCHCPGIRMDMMTEGAASLTDEEYEAMFAFGEKLKAYLKGTQRVRVESPHGADFTFRTGGKEFTVERGGNLPCGEVMLMPPVGDSFEGKLVCTSGGASRLYRETPVEIYSDNGLAGEIRCDDEEVLRKVKHELDRDEGSRYLGEFAFGINPKARLIDSFLEAEKVVGTIHMAFGGSYFPSKTHIDLLIENPTITVTKADEESIIVMDNGNFKI